MKNVKIDCGVATITVNAKMHTKPATYSAANMFLERAYVILDGDPDTKIEVTLEPKKEGSDPKQLAGDFMDELIKYEDYHQRAKQTRPIKEAILQRALATNEDSNEIFDLIEDEDIDDPEGIAVPWEETQHEDGKDQ
ncbi:hypothetical protein K9M79_07695 [Candidatus Woesearchaeota archaeon]|nr:hypothetical protein [Candidatus Woesearchaeota archaeon]